MWSTSEGFVIPRDTMNNNNSVNLYYYVNNNYVILIITGPGIRPCVACVTRVSFLAGRQAARQAGRQAGSQTARRKKERKKERTETPGQKQNVSPSYGDV